MPTNISHKEAVDAMFDHIHTSFSNRHIVEQDGETFYITNNNGKFVLITFSKESIKGSSRYVKKQLENLVKENHKEYGGNYDGTGFLFLRCRTDYKKGSNKGRNYGAFLQQSWDEDENGERDYNNVKKLKNMERGVESIFTFSENRYGYRSRVTYFNPKYEDVESVRFREHSEKHPLSRTEGYSCDKECKKRIYLPGEDIDHQRCKTIIRCTDYARGRIKRNISISKLKLPLKMKVREKGSLYLAQIVGSH